MKNLLVKALKIKSVYRLPILLVVFSLLLFLVGVCMRISVRYPGIKLKSTPVIAIPFAAMADHSIMNEEMPETAADYVITPVNTTFKTPILEPHTKRQQGPVDDAFFDDALFIGDSRTVGLSYYGLGNADYFCDIGLTTTDVLDAECEVSDFGSTTLLNLLGTKKHNKIFIMLGINELALETETIMRQYDEVIRQIREARPNADVYLMANLQITQGFEYSSSYISKDKLDTINRHLASLADNTYIFYIDVNPLFCGDDGYLSYDVTDDGCHPFGRCYGEWSEFIQQHCAEV